MKPIKLIAECTLPLLIVLPLILIFLKSKSLITKVLLFAVIFFLYQIVLRIPIEYNALRIIKGKWNWDGKIYGITFGILIYNALYNQLKPFNFLKLKQDRKALPKTVLVSFMIVCLSLFSYYGVSENFDGETLLFQLTLPGIDEELMFRGILLPLLLTCLKSRIKIGKISFGNPGVLIVGLLFGLVHGMSVSDTLVFKFEFYPFIWTFITGCCWGWITIQSKSIVQPVISHNLYNFFLIFIRMSK